MRRQSHMVYSKLAPARARHAASAVFEMQEALRCLQAAARIVPVDVGVRAGIESTMRSVGTHLARVNLYRIDMMERR